MENKLIAKLMLQRNLSKQESRSLFRFLFLGKLSEPQMKAVLLLLARKGETPDEISGCVQALEALEPKLDCPTSGLIDTCGTGGDGSFSLNVSTLAAFIIAGAGGKVAKHGNRSLSSRCGSSDLMEALGVNLAARPAKMIRAIEKCGLGYFHAPFYHPVFSKIQPLRKKLGVRTIFNFLGPMVNPLKLHYQLVGVSTEGAMKTYAKILKDKRIKRAWVCRSRDGLDEISTAVPTDRYNISRNSIQKGVIRPKGLGIKGGRRSEFRVSSVKKSRRIALSMLKGELKGSARDLVLINAGAGLVICGVAKSHQQGIEKARESLTSGRAYQTLLSLRGLTK